MKRHSFKTRVWAWLLTIVMVLGMLPSGTVSAEGAMGTVSAITGGVAVTDPAGANVTASATAVTLDWSQADGGWKVGLKVAAPEGMTKAEHFTDGTNSVTYKAGTGEAKSFWENQSSDAAAEDAARYVELWIVLTEAFVEQESLSRAWSFDWDMDGVYEQQVALTIPRSAVTLNRDGQQVYPVVYRGTVSVPAGNGVVTDASGEKPAVTFSGMSVSWSEKSEDRAAGWWISFRIQAPGNVDEAALKDAAMETDGTAGKFWDVKTSAQAPHYAELWFQLTKESADIAHTYKLDWNNDGQTDQTVSLTVDADTMTLVTVAQQELKFQNSKVTVTYGDKFLTNQVTGGSGSGLVTYEIASAGGSDIIDLNTSTGAVSVKNAGTVTIKATKAASGQYDAATATYVMEILPRPITVKISDATKKYEDTNPTFTATVTKGTLVDENAEVVMTYDAIADKPDAGSHVISGTGYVAVNDVESKNYTVTVENGTLTVQRSGRTVSFEQSGPQSVVFGTESFTNKLVVDKENGKSKVTYAIAKETGIDAEVDQNGVVTIETKKPISQSGTIIVKATVAADNGYEEASAEYTLTVSPMDVSGVQYNLSETANDQGWYKENVIVTVLGEYEIGLGEDGKFPKEWKAGTEGEVLDREGEHDYVIYLKKDKHFAAPLKIENIRIDRGEPEDIRVEYSEKIIAEDGNVLFFDQADILATVFFGDAVSGVASVEIDLGDGKTPHFATAKEIQDGKCVVKLNSNARNEILVTVTDAAGWTKTYTKTAVVDSTKPVVTLTQAGEKVAANGDRNYYTGKVTLTVTVKETNFVPGNMVVNIDKQNAFGAATTAKVMIKTGDGEVAFDKDYNDYWVSNGEEHTLTLIFSEDTNYTVTVTGTDKAGNKAVSALNTTQEETVSKFTIDTGLPHTQKLAYLNAEPADILTEFVEAKVSFFNNRMYIVVQVRDDISGIRSMTVTADGYSAEMLELIQDSNIFQAAFAFPKEALNADNQFNGYITVDAVDWAGNSLGAYTFQDNKLVVDNIAPVGAITPAQAVQEVGGVRYYAGNIQVAIAITEANYQDYKDNTDKTVKPVITVTKDGGGAAFQQTGWPETGNRPSSTVTLTEDGEYRVVVTYTDGSGNPMATLDSGKLVLDTTLPQITVTNIKNNSANKDDPYSFLITVTDINLDSATVKPVLTAVTRGEDGLYTTKQIDLGAAQVLDDGDTVQFTVNNLEKDALYTLTCSAKDLADNECKQMLLADGKGYETVEFSINREGSTFGFGSEATNTMIDQYYVYSVEEDVVIVEVNVDPIETYTVTLNGAELTEGSDYTTSQTSNPDEWSKRTYVISKSLFAQEGQYNIVVSSTDKTNTTAYSDIKDLAVAFVVDQTAPVLTISGLQEGGRYQTSEQLVTLIPTDEGGRLNALKILVLDSDGNPLTDETGKDISLRFELSGEELYSYLDENGGTVSFTVPTGLELQVQVICNDCAVNAQGQTNEYNELFRRVTVSENAFVIFYANKAAFFGTIGGVAALAILIVILLKRKKSAK